MVDGTWSAAHRPYWLSSILYPLFSRWFSSIILLPSSLPPSSFYVLRLLAEPFQLRLERYHLP
jgi:hypothetical protein